MAIASIRRAPDVSPLTPPRYKISSGSYVNDDIAADDPLFVAGDSPLPSPPSISRPANTQKSLGSAGVRQTADLKEKVERGEAPHTADFSTLKCVSASTMPEWRSSAPSSSNQPPPSHPHTDAKSAMTLAESMGASPPPLRNGSAVFIKSTGDRPRLESKFGIEPLRPSTRAKLPSHSRAFSHTSTRAASEEQQEQSRMASTSSRPASFNPHGISVASEGGITKMTAPRDAKEPQESGSRPSSSLAIHEREVSRGHKVVDVAVASGARVSRRRIAYEESAEAIDANTQKRQAQAGEGEFRGKSSAGSDSMPSSSSPQQHDATSGNSSKGAHSGSSREEKPFSYVTPALAAGARIMRSNQTATASRSAGRTLRRLGPGEARPAHARAVRVMVPQVPLESDGEEEEETPGVGVGSGRHDGTAVFIAAKDENVVRGLSLPLAQPMIMTDRSTSAETLECSPRDSPPLYSSSNFMVGLSLRPVKPRSPDVQQQQESKGTSAMSNARQVSHASREHRLAHEGRTGEKDPDEICGRPASLAERPAPGVKSVSPPPMPLGAEEEDDEEEENAVLTTNANALPSPGHGDDFPLKRSGRSDVLQDALRKRQEAQARLSAEAKENEPILPRAAAAAAAYRKTLESILHAKVPSFEGGAAAGSQRVSAAINRQPLSSHGQATNGPAALQCQEVQHPVVLATPQMPMAAGSDRAQSSSNMGGSRVLRAMPPSPASGSFGSSESYDFARLEPDIEAEKTRLLTLNGWDPWVQAVFEEAQRQRYNGSSFGQHLVGKPLPTRKETKFRGCRYMKVSKAGDGGFSSVFQVLGPAMIPGANGLEVVPQELQGWFALKQVTLKGLEQSSKDGLVQEAMLLDDLSQLPDSEQYLVRYFGHKHTGETLKMLLELGESDFNRHLVAHHPLPRPELSKYYKQMLASVNFVHSAGLLHTDLKPANFLMIQGRIKIIDFGIAEKIPIGTLHIRRDNIVGTPNYMAPETIQQKGAEQEGVVAYKTGKPADVWSLGCILYQMVYGKTPFADYSGPAKLKMITNRNHVISYPLKRQPDSITEGDAAVEEVDEMLLDCLKSALIYDADKRAKISTLLDHAFVRDDVTLGRRKLKSIVLRIHSYMQQGTLTEDNVEEMADRLMTNLQLEVFRPFGESLLEGEK